LTPQDPQSGAPQIGALITWRGKKWQVTGTGHSPKGPIIFLQTPETETPTTFHLRRATLEAAGSIKKETTT